MSSFSGERIVIKPGVKTADLTKCTKWGLFECEKVFAAYDLDMVVTSGNDGIHKQGSRHNQNRAFDLRLPSRVVAKKYETPWKWDSRSPIDETICLRLQETLGSDFTIILELHQNNPWQWHIHIELDPDDN